MAVKLIALDMDGTTLTSDNRLTEKTKETLIKANNLGVEIVPVTGRCYCSLPEEIIELAKQGYINYVITSNGAEIRDIKNRTIIYDNYIDEVGIKEIKSVLDKNNRMVEVYVKGKAYIERSYYEKVRKGQINYRNQNYVLGTRVPVKGVKQLLDVHSKKIEKIAVYFPYMADVQKVREEFSLATHIAITSSGRNNLEFIAENCNKAEALKKLCDIVDVKLAETVAFGDSDNDYEMMSISGMSVAMGNAEKNIKASASLITLDNDCDGVAIAIDKLLAQCN